MAIYIKFVSMKGLHTFMVMSPYKNSRLSSCSCARTLWTSLVVNLSGLCSKTLLIIVVTVKPNVACCVSLTCCIVYDFYKYLNMQKKKKNYDYKNSIPLFDFIWNILIKNIPHLL